MGGKAIKKECDKCSNLYRHLYPLKKRNKIFLLCSKCFQKESRSIPIGKHRSYKNNHNR